MRNYSSLEILESRVAPAGLVNATLVAGKLVLTGDSGDNILAVQLLGPGHYHISGGGGTVVSLNGGMSSPSVDLTGTSVTSVIANLGDGNDNLILANLSLPNGLTFNGGNGNDVLNLANPNAFGPVVLKGGAGDDSYAITGTAATMASLTVDLGDGTNLFQTSPGLLKVAGATKIVGGSGVDTISIAGSTVQLGSVMLDGDGGANVLSIGGGEASIAGSVVMKNGPHVSGTSFAAFSGSDLQVGGSVIASFGAGQSSFGLSVGNTNIAGGISVTSGGDADSVSMGGGSLFHVGGAVKLALGAGTNTAGISASNLSLGSLIISTGADADGVGVSGSVISIHGPTQLALGGGANTTTFSGASVQLSGPVTITGGAAVDVASVSGDFVSLGAVTAGLGDGANILTLGGGTFLHVKGGILEKSGAHMAGTSGFTLNANAVKVDGSVMLQFGDGANSASLSAGSTIHIGGSVTGEASSAGIDTWFVSTSSLEVGGALSFQSGDSGSATTISATVGSVGSLSIHGGSDGDSVAATFDGTVVGATTISLGTGSDSIIVSGSTTGLHLAGPLQIVTHSGAADFESVSITNLKVSGASNISLGAASSLVTVQDGLFGAFTLNSGDGADTVNIETVNMGIASIFHGAADIRLGAGDDKLTVGGGTVVSSAHFGSTVKFDGGAGTDLLTNLGNIFKPGQPVITGF